MICIFAVILIFMLALGHAGIGLNGQELAGMGWNLLGLAGIGWNGPEWD